MVGVPGRSKACENCRRRRIKCGLEQPACHRCVKAKLICGGIRDLTFILHTNRTSASQSNRSDNGAEREAALVLSKKNATEPTMQLFQSISIPHDETFLAYYRARLLQGPDAGDLRTPRPGDVHSLGDASALALATTFFGTEHGDGSIVQKGLSRYSRALKGLNAALGDPAQCQSFDLLEAVLTMSLFEYLMSERTRGWSHHARGFERLMELRGPEAFTSLPELIIMERTRASIIFAALTERKPTILTRPEWKSIPWVLYPERRTPMQKLLDIFADCPSLLSVKQSFQHGDHGDETKSQYIRLLEKVNSLLLELDVIEQSWKSTIAFRVREDPIQSSSKNQPWSASLQYESLAHADLAMLGNGIRILLLQLIYEIHSFQTLHTRQHLLSQIHEAAMDICRSIDYELQEIDKGASNHLLFWPVRQAQQAMVLTGYDDPDLQLRLGAILESMSNGLAGRWNMKLREHFSKSH